MKRYSSLGTHLCTKEVAEPPRFRGSITCRQLREFLIDCMRPSKEPTGPAGMTLLYMPVNDTITYQWHIKRIQPNNVVLVNVYSSDNGNIRDYQPLDMCIGWQMLLAELDAFDCDVLLEHKLGCELLGNTVYSNMLKQCMSRYVKGLGVTVDDLLGRGNDGYVCSHECCMKMIQELDFSTPYSSEMAEKSTQLKGLMTILGVVHGKVRRITSLNSIIVTHVINNIEKLGMASYMQ